jgi:hypothetical protein
MQCIKRRTLPELSIRAIGHQGTKVRHRAQHALPVSQSGFLAVPRSSTLSSPRPLKVAAAAHDCYTLVHDRLADPKVAVDPLPNAGGFGEGV